MEKAITLQATIRNAFATAFLLSLMIGIAGGLVVSRRFLARVDSFNRIAEDIGHQGTLERRLPMVGSGDDFDQMAGIVNVMLERIENLVYETRQVTTNIAHDLRTPLGRIRQKLEELGNPSKSPEETSRIREEALFLLDETLQTFSALLHLAEIESGIHRNRFSEVDLTEILQSLTTAYSSVAEEQGLSLICSAAGMAKIRGDKRLLNQLFVNLIENAIRHAGQGAKIHIALELLTDRACISIADNGRGVPETEWKNILKPFYRLDTSRNSPGNGLGLSFVSAIARLHSASLAFEDNRPGLKVTLMFGGLQSG